MCVLAFAWQVHPRWRLLLVGNRDEMHARPTAPLARWDDDPNLIAGRDLEAGGTWMGVHAPGRVAVVTNVRDPRAAMDGRSRGLLVSEFLRGQTGAAQHGAQLAATAAAYRPFNLLLFDAEAGCFVSNRPGPRVVAVKPGVHGLSNGDFNEPWPKLCRATVAIQHWLDRGDDDFGPLFATFRDRAEAPDAALPHTGVGPELERRLSAVFVASERYGTRATTLIAIDATGAGYIIEQRFGPEGIDLGRSEVRFEAGVTMESPNARGPVR